MQHAKVFVPVYFIHNESISYILSRAIPYLNFLWARENEPSSMERISVMESQHCAKGSFSSVE